jgi:hypothetical protein
MEKYLVIHKDAGETGKVLHFGGPNNNDMALCGHDLAGDESLGWTVLGPVIYGRVNCPNCIAIVQYCRKIKANELENA